MKKDILTITNYTPFQIKIEEDNYDKSMALYNVLIASLADYMETNNYVTKQGIIDKVNRWFTINSNTLYAINTDTVNQIGGMLQESLGFEKRSIIAEVVIRNELNLNTDNLVSAIQGIFMTAVPVGMGILPFGNDSDIIPTDRESLVTRAINSVKRNTQTGISEATTNLIVDYMFRRGYTEYLGDNEHDDRVRESHRRDNDGDTWRSLMNPPPTGYPATEYGCRCRFIAFR